MKYCKGCNQEKEFSKFTKIRPKKSGGFTYSTLCNACNYAIHKEYYSQLQKEKIRKKRETTPDGRTLRRGPRGPRRPLVEKTCRLCGETKSASEFKHGRVCAACMPGYQAEAHQRHKEYYRRKCAARQRGLKEIPGSHTDQEWEALKAKYNNTCLRCGKVEPEIKLTRDHVIPITKGGTDDIGNIQPLCVSCNSCKSDKHIDYR